MTEMTPGRISIMITKAQRQRLREMGYDDETIGRMTPAEAHQALGISGKVAIANE